MRPLVCLVLVAVVLLATHTVDGKRKKVKTSHASTADLMHEMQAQVDELTARLDTMSSGSGGGGDGTCPSSKVNLHFHGHDVTADDVDADGTHVHIQLGHDDKHDHDHEHEHNHSQHGHDDKHDHGDDHSQHGHDDKHDHEHEHDHSQHGHDDKHDHEDDHSQHDHDGQHYHDDDHSQHDHDGQHDHDDDHSQHDHDGQHDHDDDDHDHEDHIAYCEMVAAGNTDVAGHVHIIQPHYGTSSLHVSLSKLDDLNTDHMLHVHQSGDLSSGCDNVGDHYNPYHHGMDVGDMGTVLSDSDGEVDGVWINDTMLSLAGRYSIIGRSVVVHGANHAKVACCVIGWSADNVGQTGGGHAHGIAGRDHVNNNGGMKHDMDHGKAHPMRRRSIFENIDLKKRV